MVEFLPHQIKNLEGVSFDDVDEKIRGTKNLYLRARIPSASFNSFMNEADGLGKIISRSTNVENITKQYNDNASQIESLKIQESRLLEMMEKAEIIDEMITVEARLSEIQSQLKSANNYQSSMDTDVEYSTVTINVAEVMEFTPLETGMVTSNFFRRLQDTLKWTWTFFVWLIQQLILTAIRLIPLVVIIGGIVLICKAIFKDKKFKLPKFRIKKKEE